MPTREKKIKKYIGINNLVDNRYINKEIKKIFRVKEKQIDNERFITAKKTAHGEASSEYRISVLDESVSNNEDFFKRQQKNICNKINYHKNKTSCNIIVSVNEIFI